MIDLARTSLINCNGAVTHDLTLLPDGRVQVVCGTVTSTVDPRTGVIHPPGYRLPEDVLAAARTLATDVFG